MLELVWRSLAPLAGTARNKVPSTIRAVQGTWILAVGQNNAVLALTHQTAVILCSQKQIKTIQFDLEKQV